ncbi:MAG: alpha/beta hydrolase [Firmicutes bacterium]|nr:alpha/beta hydrolase [Bacillota bacterium]
MGGSYDIWWQQIEAFEDRYRIVSVTYPPVNSLAGLSRGITEILKKENIYSVYVLGTSLGGYLAQYLVAEHPEIVKKAVFANTFPPNDIILEKNGRLGSLLPYLPEWLIMKSFRGSILNSVVPAANNSELVKAFLLEQSYGLMSKAQFIGRYRCVVDPFTPGDPESHGNEYTRIIEGFFSE